jgi:hypothetical protein
MILKRFWYTWTPMTNAKNFAFWTFFFGCLMRFFKWNKPHKRWFETQKPQIMDFIQRYSKWINSKWSLTFRSNESMIVLMILLTFDHIHWKRLCFLITYEYSSFLTCKYFYKNHCFIYCLMIFHHEKILNAFAFSWKIIIIFWILFMFEKNPE